MIKMVLKTRGTIEITILITFFLVSLIVLFVFEEKDKSKLRGITFAILVNGRNMVPLDVQFD